MLAIGLTVMASRWHTEVKVSLKVLLMTMKESKDGKSYSVAASSKV